MIEKQASILLLEDGSEYPGRSFGADVSVSGEVVFNTGMVGYNESLTDPSYKGQILVFTYPLIGNYGVPSGRVVGGLHQGFESEKIQVSGLIVSDYSFESSHWQSVKSLADWCKDEGIPAVTGIDTRALTQRLREKGTMLGKIICKDEPEFYDPNKDNLVKKVSIPEPVLYNKKGKKKILVIDCGVKHSIIRSLTKRDCCVLRVPCDHDFFGYEFSGVIISNGPGDPKMCLGTIESVRRCLSNEIPIFGICLGNQLLALAAGADTYKLKYGHRGQNQPCQEIGTKRCHVTSQNHGYAVKTESLPDKWTPWFRNINDGTNEGILHKEKPFFSIQFHPEHSPGPVDTEHLFDRFLKIVKK